MFYDIMFDDLIKSRYFEWIAVRRMYNVYASFNEIFVFCCLHSDVVWRFRAIVWSNIQYTNITTNKRYSTICAPWEIFPIRWIPRTEMYRWSNPWQWLNPRFVEKKNVYLMCLIETRIVNGILNFNLENNNHDNCTTCSFTTLIF